MNKDLRIAKERLNELNDFLINPKNSLLNKIHELIEEYGGPKTINRKASAARKLSNLMKRMANEKSPYLKDINWLIQQRDKGAFVSMNEYRKRILGRSASKTKTSKKNAVTLEISALQYFPYLIAEAKRAIQKRELMPGRFIRVRAMKEQVEDGDLLAVTAAMQVFGSSWVETLDTKGTDGSNPHLGGPETITGYFGGVGQPNDHAIRWAEEYLHYATNYGVQQVLNINAGTILVAYLFYKLGVDIQFKISVYMGNDNPFSVLWTLLTARLFSRPDGSTPLVGFNFANSVNNETIRFASDVRKALGMEKAVRFE
ncbi:MAG: hypothetical protein ABIH42_05060, partial [Planctomycetota bacterium]